MTVSELPRSGERANQARATIVDRVRRWAKQRPNERAYVFVTERTEQVLSYAELDRRARGIARSLAVRAPRGATALLLYPLGLDFVAAFFGCLYAGVVAVPLHPGRGKTAEQRLRLVARDSGARLALTTSSLAADCFDSHGALDGLDLVVTDRSEPAGEALPDLLVPPSPETVAFLQYTSGSTTAPRGTVVSHGNVSANLDMIASAFGTGAGSVIVSWLPVFHDMGLIGNVLHSAHLGATAVLLPTLAFLKSPMLWLRTIQRYRADFSGAPNFAYDLCVDRTTRAERSGLELGCWRVAFNGAEPVRARTLERFATAFAPCGFKMSAFVPTYGLAEATLLVAGGSPGKPTCLRVDEQALRDHVVVAPQRDDAAKVLVGNGTSELGDQVVAIVDPSSGRRCAASEVGEIWVSGSHVARGYFQNETETAQTFGARLAGDARPYLRTGDLGFFHDESLFVTGRIKDLIVFRGQNLYPQDIELTLELALPGLRKGATAAFESDDEVTGIVVLAELEVASVPTPEALASVARRLQEAHEVPLKHLVLVRRNTLPKTTSGKIQRRRCRLEYERGDYVPLAAFRSDARELCAALEQRVRSFAAAWIAREQGLARETLTDTGSLAGYGVDSIRKVALVSALEREFALVVPESSFFAIDCIDDLARAVSAPDEPPSSREVPAAVTLRSSGDAVFPGFSPMSWEREDD